MPTSVCSSWCLTDQTVPVRNQIFGPFFIIARLADFGLFKQSRPRAFPFDFGEIYGKANMSIGRKSIRIVSTSELS